MISRVWKRCTAIRIINTIKIDYLWRSTHNESTSHVSSLQHRSILEEIGKEVGVNTLNDWYKVPVRQVQKRISFLHEYGNLFNALQKLYPHHDWDPTRFSEIPRGFWTDENTRSKALEKVGTRLGVKELHDWYNVDASVVRRELSFIQRLYHDSLYLALKKLYPHYHWDPLKFNRVPRGYWNDPNTQRDALEKVGKELGVKELDDWYNVDARNVRKKLRFIMHYHNDSLPVALKKLYPQHNWNPLKFSKVPQGYWQEPKTVEHYRVLFKRWRKKHNIQKLKDWYQLPPKQLKLFQRASVGIFGSVNKMLKKWFPETNWIDELQGSTPELELKMMLQLVEEEVLLHHRIGKHSVDIFIPEWNIAIEYQGIQHYQPHWRGDFNDQQRRDEDKSAFLLQQETPILLVPINYRWNRTWSQLRSTIRGKEFDTFDH